MPVCVWYLFKILVFRRAVLLPMTVSLFHLGFEGFFPCIDQFINRFDGFRCRLFAALCDGCGSLFGNLSRFLEALPQLGQHIPQGKHVSFCIREGYTQLF